MKPRIYPLECQFTNQEGDKNLHNFLVEFAFFNPLFLNAFYYKSPIVRR